MTTSSMLRETKLAPKFNVCICFKKGESNLKILSHTAESLGGESRESGWHYQEGPDYESGNWVFPSVEKATSFLYAAQDLDCTIAGRVDHVASINSYSAQCGFNL